MDAEIDAVCKAAADAGALLCVSEAALAFDAALLTETGGMVLVMFATCAAAPRRPSAA